MNSDSSSRREVLSASLIALCASGLPQPILDLVQNPDDITTADLAAVEKLAGVAFNDDERKRLLGTLRQLRSQYVAWRAAGIDYRDEPPTHFVPIGGYSDPRATVRYKNDGVRIRKPKTDEDLAFLHAHEQAELIRTRALSSVELTHLYLERLKRYGPKMLNLVTLTENLALEQARRADEEIKAGRYRGPLHGLPYGLKDLFAVRGYPTTWGANTFEHQHFEHDATVYKRLEAAGAVLVAKLSMGALALGDLWFKGRTKSPWKIDQGSSGSSAGSASASAAGLVSFAIGTETLGSIMSPSFACRVSGHRPTYGRVSRYGAMGLSYTMDKVGPISRSLRDCAMVFAHICGEDVNDPSAVSRSFNFPAAIDWKKLKIGHTLTEAQAASDPVIAFLREKGAQVKGVKFSPLPDGLTTILSVESASAFEEFTRTGEARKLENSPWAETFRGYRYVSAVDYLQAMRLRSKTMRKFEDELGDLDCVLANTIGGALLSMTNLTGHPQIHIPMGVNENGALQGRSLIGRLYADDRLLSIGWAIQSHFDYHRRRPDLKIWD